MSEQSTNTTVGGDVVVEVDVAAPPEAVFDHLVVPEKVMRWMGLDGELDIRPGGEFFLRLAPDVTARGRYVEISPPHWVMFTWGWDGSDDVPPGSSTVRIELSPIDDTTRVRLIHSELPEETADDHTDGWRYFTARLATAAEGGDPGPIDLAAVGSDDETGDTT